MKTLVSYISGRCALAASCVKRRHKEEGEYNIQMERPDLSTCVEGDRRSYEGVGAVGRSSVVFQRPTGYGTVSERTRDTGQNGDKLKRYFAAVGHDIGRRAELFAVSFHPINNYVTIKVLRVSRLFP